MAWMNLDIQCIHKPRKSALGIMLPRQYFKQSAYKIYKNENKIKTVDFLTGVYMKGVSWVLAAKKSLRPSSSKLLLKASSPPPTLHSVTLRTELLNF